ncbi:nitrate reductase associated protein [Stenomitos frigidus]|uniref:Nitrate reductase associated protein n=1 Tax=Stenomitos frigidus ULC18 TaxID=2107698 RepID=A0A2T1E2N8_9CYAN|nr:nitrate reductase associated protein [Stenomitos frigidus]PSB27006.1 nitrate reductase associated protein [Stenomitos frigidus ULC18]
MTQFFQFEADFVASLRCIPMQVRLKLDTCGVKLKLTHWHQFNQDDRQALIELPCETTADVQRYQDFLHQLIQDRTGTTASDLAIDPAPAWLDSSTIPDSVKTKAEESGVAIAIHQWATLAPVQRFALIKLSRSNHENANFLPALKEFHLV